MVHTDTNMNSGLLILVFASYHIAAVQITQISLFLCLFIIVDNLELDQWLRFVE